MNKILFSLIPKIIRRTIHHTILRMKFDVRLGKNSTAHNTYFEGKNSIGVEASLKNSYIGKGSYISGFSYLNDVKLGKFCSLGRRVIIGGFGTHPTNWLSTHPAFFSTKEQAGFTYAKMDIFNESIYVDIEKKYHVIIGNDVWIGNNVIILDGVTIGDGVIIGAGAVVAKDINPYAIVGGVPAKLIRYRFSDLLISKIIDSKWWDNDEEWFRQNWKKFSNPEELI
jgi:acetyltransferase-like isoleucine patch superfamily enzyme